MIHYTLLSLLTDSISQVWNQYDEAEGGHVIIRQKMSVIIIRKKYCNDKK